MTSSQRNIIKELSCTTDWKAIEMVKEKSSELRVKLIINSGLHIFHKNPIKYTTSSSCELNVLIPCQSASNKTQLLPHHCLLVETFLAVLSHKQIVSLEINPSHLQRNNCWLRRNVMV